MSSTVEQIKSKLNIVDVVGSYLKLEKAGGNLKARCPFHNEKTPSFYVSPARESFHCFGCSKGGDIFEFVKEMEGIEFVDALKILAERAGVRIVNDNNSERSEKGRLISVLENATLFFQNELIKNPPALEYLKKRGLNDETISMWKIGFAPDSWRTLYDHLRKLKFTDSEIEKTGLTISSPKGYYDRFRNRIMFPINNISGVTVGYSGRIFGSGSQQDVAKYINSPQTDLYDKSKVLFGFDRGRVKMRTDDVCILVEGQMDLIMSHQAGNPNTVASSGTALTEEHLKNIKRLANKLILAFDGDEAGFKASHRGIDMALAMGMDVRVAKLPLGVDPADLILEDPSKWTQAVSEAKHIIDFYLETLESRGYESRRFKIEVEKLILPYVARIKSSIEQAHFVNFIARKLAIDEAPVWDQLRKIGGSDQVLGRFHPIGGQADPKEPVTNVSETEMTRADYILKKLIGIILWQKSIVPKDDEIDKKEREMMDIVGEGKYFLLREILKDKKDSLIFEAEATFQGTQKVVNYLDELILDLKETVLKDNLNNTIIRLKKAENIEDQNEIVLCLRLCQEISQELVNIKQIKNKNI